MTLKREIKHGITPLYSSMAESIYRWKDACRSETDIRAFEIDVAALVMILIDYGIYGQEPDMIGKTERVIQAWIFLKPNIDSYQKRSDGGRTGGRPRKVPVSEYIEQQMNGTLPENKPASQELIDTVKALQEKL